MLYFLKQSRDIWHSNEDTFKSLSKEFFNDFKIKTSKIKENVLKQLNNNKERIHVEAHKTAYTVTLKNATQEELNDVLNINIEKERYMISK